MTALQVRTLGSMELLYAGKPVPLPATRKAQALLVYLILRREQPQGRERLAELFWGDRPAEKARRSLSTAVWHITHCLPDKAYLLSDPATLQFNPQAELQLDSAAFESLLASAGIPRLQAAMQLYRGEFLPGSYEDWIIAERYRLENLYLDGLARLMAAYENSAAYQPALETALRLLEQDAYREDAQRAAMRLYCRLGRRNAALEQYQRCRQIIWAELGAEPMPETTRLYQAILDGQYPALEAAPENLAAAWNAVPELAASQRQPGRNPLDLNALPPFLGREAEMAALGALWQRAGALQGLLVLLHGEAGVGKTRLAAEFADRLRWKGIQVLWGRCYEFERILPYQPVAEALRSALPCAAGSEQFWMVHALTRLVPELASAWAPASPPPATLAPPAELAGQLDQACLFEAVRCFLSGYAQPRGLLLILEDLHWAADSTFEMLHYLLRHLAAAPVLILGTLRPEELGQSHPLRSFQEQLKREGLLEELHLGRLAPAVVEQLVAQMSGQGEAILPLARRLYKETEGNPFFLVEVIRALFENRSISIENSGWLGDFSQISASQFPLPASLAEVVRSRIQRLDEDACQALAIASVIGREFDFSLLQAAWGRSEEQTLQALEILLRSRLVEEGSGATSRDYAFTHHKIQEVLYADLPRRRRWQAHARIGELLEQSFSAQNSTAGSGAAFPDAHAGELAYHFFQARQLNAECTEKAITCLLKAGDQARLLYAEKEASGHYLQALELLKGQGNYERTARVNMKLGATYHNAFEYERAHQAFEEGLRLWQQLSRIEAAALPAASHPLRTNWPPISSIDPAYGMDFAGAIDWQLFSALVAFSPDLEVIPDAAQKWQVYAGGREYLFHLKDDLHWSDGSPFTAHDFEYAGRRMLAPETQSPFANLLYDLKGARACHQGQLADAGALGLRAIDPATLLLELEKPASYFLQLLANFVAVPQACIAAHGDKWTEAECILSSGPFKIERWQKGERMLLARNPAYHGPYTGNLPGVQLNLHPDPAEHVTQYARGEMDVLDMRFYPVAVYEKLLREYAGEYFSLPAASLCFLGFNVRLAPFHDERLRLAFALALDKEMLAALVQRGSVFPATGGFIPPGLPGHSPGIGLPYAPGRAKDLLAQAGYPGGCGFPEIQALTPLDPGDPLNASLAGQWGEILGVKVTWQTVVPGLHLVLEKSPPQLFLSYWHADYPDPDDFLGASQILNWTGWREPAYLQALEETRATAEQPRRMQIFAQADRLLVAKAALVPLSYNRQHLLLKPWVKRYPTSALFSWFWKDVLIEEH